MGSFMQSGRGGYGTGGGASGFPTVFGGSGDTATPALLDPTEFPSLTNVRGQNDQSLPQTNPLQPPGSKPYGNFFTSCEFFNDILTNNFFFIIINYFKYNKFALCIFCTRINNVHIHTYVYTKNNWDSWNMKIVQFANGRWCKHFIINYL